MSYHRDTSVPPSTEDLLLAGFEQWQIDLMRKLQPELQWMAYEEFFRRLMQGDDPDGLFSIL